MFNELRKRYFEWISSSVCSSKDEFMRSASLLEQLYAIPFEYSSICPNDSNRKIDGYELRQRFMEECHETPDILQYISGPCSVLEALVALSQRIEKDIMFDMKYGDRTSEWFWMMLNNLGIQSDTSVKDVDDRIQKWLQRDYGFNGYGGLFPLEDAGEDQSKVEIWYQMNTYMLEKYGS